jgi:hypothetical protein
LLTHCFISGISKKYDVSLKFSKPNSEFSQIYKYSLSNNVVAIDVNDLICVCFHIILADLVYIIKPVNLKKIEENKNAKKRIDLRLNYFLSVKKLLIIIIIKYDDINFF